jgi:hypothetical protein
MICGSFPSENLHKAIDSSPYLIGKPSAAFTTGPKNILGEYLPLVI